MTHWGWYWKIKKSHSARTLCSKLTSIDSFKLYKSDIRFGFRIQPIGIKAEAYPDYLKITYGKRKNYSYTIPIEKLSCNYGDIATFFIVRYAANECDYYTFQKRVFFFAESA